MKATLGDRSAFETLQAKAYLNHAAISPPSRVVMDAVSTVVQDYAVRGVGAFMTYLEQRERLRARLATFIGAQTDEIGYVANTTSGVVFAAMCFPWERGDGVVLLDGEFPANVTPWQQAAAMHDLRIDRIPVSQFGSPDPGQGLAALDSALRAGAKLVAVSAVQFQTGLRMPLRAISALAHRHGAAVFVDAIQACGSTPFDVAAMDVDLATCGGHKWLMGLEGTGFVYVRQSWAERLRPRLAGWLSHHDGLGFLFDGPGNLRYDRPIKRNASMSEGGAYNAVGFAALDASLGLLEQLGVEAIAAHVQRYHDALEPRLSALGLCSRRSPSPGERSSILSFDVPDHVDCTALPALLGERKVAITLPDGLLRFAPHWPNALDEIDLVVDAVDDALKAATR